MTPILEIQKLSHIYSPDTPFEHAALSNVDLTISRGEFVGLIGHTGSGKSTLVQHMNGLLKPTSGHVLFDGRDIWEDPKFTRQIRFRVGLVFQYPEYQLFEETVYADIAFGPKNMGLSKDEIDARVRRAAGFVGISEAELAKSPFDLSGGQKRRAAIAGVIAMEPDVLILDEPTAGLDPAGRESILKNIRDYQAAQQAAVVMVSHSMEEIASNVDRLIVMEKGTAVMTDAPSEVFSHAAELVSMGLNVPCMTQVLLRLQQLGVNVPASAYTVEQAADLLEPLLKGGAQILIQKAEGKLLREIIEEKGTDGFIEVENRVNSQIRTTHSVIATGGSVVYGKEAMEHLGSIGTIVYLKQNLKPLERRLRNIKGRGVVLKPGQTLAGLYKERVVLYEKYADIIVDEYKLNVEQTLDAVLQALKEKNGTEKAEDE